MAPILKFFWLTLSQITGKVRITIRMDPRQLTSTFMAMRQRLLASARQILGNDDDAVDALQDAFVGLWSRAGSLSDAQREYRPAASQGRQTGRRRGIGNA